MKENNHLVMIDPQNDFCDPKGNLAVPTGLKDMKNLATFIAKLGDRLAEIHCTLDSHQTVDIAHPIFWVDSKGNHPQPFTIITSADVADGKWRSYNPKWQQAANNYVKALAANNRYPLCIWPYHCLIGSWGHALVPDISRALIDWEQKFNRVDFVVKGSNFMTEHYSGVQADVPDDNDPTTKLNTRLLDVLSQADCIYFTGQALSHCVANTIRDIANNFGEENIKKIVLLTDTTSNVPGFEKMGEDFIKEMTPRGMQVAKTTDFI